MREPVRQKIVTEPTVEPVTLAEAEMHLRIESQSIATALTTTQSIAPADHAVAAAYSLEGDGVDVLSSQGTVVYLISGTNAAGATVDVKIQESDDDIAYTDWTGGAFAQVTTANDNATYEKEYTGIKQYIRTVATVAVDAANFSTVTVESAPESVEDDYITALIQAARRILEQETGWNFITQTWELALNRFPVGAIELPWAPLQSVVTIKYYDVDDTAATFANTNYYVSTYAKPGTVSLNFSAQWPTTVLRPVDGVIIQYKTGMGNAASDVYEQYKTAIKMMVAELYERREDSISGTIIAKVPWNVRQLLQYEEITAV